MEQVLYKLPDGWDYTDLASLCKFENGDRGKNYPSRDAFVESGIPVINAGNLNGREIIEAELNYITRERYDILGSGKVRQGDLLFCLRGSLGKCAIVSNLNEGAIASSLVIVRPSEVIDPNYLLYYFNSPLCSTFIERYNNGAAQPNLSAKSLSKFLIPLTSQKEQKRIVEKLDALLNRIDTAIEHLQESVTLADVLVKSSLSSMLTKQEHWDKVSLSDVCQITSKLCDPREEPYLDMFHVGGANITSFSGELIDLKTARDERLISGKFPFDNSMVLYSKIRPYLMKVARPSFSGICSADIYPLTPDKQKMSRDFLFYLLLSDLFTQYAIEGSSRAGMPKVNRNHLFNFEFYLPPIDEQKSICESLDALVEKTNEVSKELTDKLSYLAGLKASILDSAFKGEL